MKFKVVAPIVIILLALGISLLVGAEKGRRRDMESPNAPAPQGEPGAGEPTPWTYMGDIPDSYYSSRVFRRRDPETGAWIYIMVGQQGRGGIFVLPAEKISAAGLREGEKPR